MENKKTESLRWIDVQELDGTTSTQCSWPVIIIDESEDNPEVVMTLGLLSEDDNNASIDVINTVVMSLSQIERLMRMFVESANKIKARYPIPK